MAKKTIIRLKKDTAATFTFGDQRLLPGGTLEVSAEDYKRLLENNADILEDGGDAEAPAKADTAKADAAAKEYKNKLQGMKKDALVALATEAKMPDVDKAKPEDIITFLLTLPIPEKA